MPDNVLLKKLKYSIVIPVLNESRVRKCAEAILTQNIEPGSYEVIVVDNGSTTVNTSELLRDLPVKVIHEPKQGIAAATNAGIFASSGEILVRIDGDCIPETNWLRELTSCFVEPRIGGVGGVIFKEPGHTLVERSTRGLVIGNQIEPSFLPIIQYPYVVTANAAFRMDLVRNLGGFDQSLQSGSDVDICWRISLSGYQIITTPKAVVLHASRASVRSYFRQFYRYALGHAALAYKYKKLTGKRRIGTWYPIRGLFRVLLKELPHTLRRGNRESYMRMYLNMIEYIALLAGDLVGFSRYHVLYI